MAMVSTNFSQQDQTQTNVYQYNYTYLEPIAMVDTLPKDQNFSVPWIVIAGQQVLKLMINTLIVDLGNGKQRGSNDVVKDFLRQVFLQTLQEQGKSFKLKLIGALKELFPQMEFQGATPDFSGSPKGADTGLPQSMRFTKGKC
jgi:arachidonate 15-lipoxygenase